MNRSFRVSALGFVGLLSPIITTNAEAATYVQDVLVTFNQPANVIASQLTGTASGPSIGVQAGDIVEGSVTFAGGDRLTLFDIGSTPDSELFILFSSAAGGILNLSNEVTLTGVSGSPISSNTFSYVTSGNGYSLRNSNAAGQYINLTNSQISFTGINFRISVNSGSGTLTPNLFVTSRGSYGLNGAVPEPATWAMMIVGFGAVGGNLRSRRTSRMKMLAA